MTATVGRSRSLAYRKRGLWAIKAKNGGAFPKHAKVVKPVPEAEKPPKYYPADDAPKPLRNRHKLRPTKLRSSITPGTVLILLAGRYKGKRVVFLKQLASGLLLITGPHKLNGVPVRRVDQAYVIGTSTKVDVSSVDLSKFDDSLFKKPAKKRTKKSEDRFFEQEAAHKLPEECKEAQKALDGMLMPIIANTPDLQGYLSARFSLLHGVKPHELVF